MVVYLGLNDSDNNPDYRLYNINGEFQIYDSTNAAVRFNIKNNKVGIGTNNPARDFHVVGTSRFEQLDVVGFSTFGGSGTKFFHHVPRIEMQGIIALHNSNLQMQLLAPLFLMGW